jgi:flagellar operon protein
MALRVDADERRPFAVAQPGAGTASPVEPGEPTAQRIDPSLSAAVRAQVAFADVLQRIRTADAGGIQFSSHAQRRLQSRGITFGQEELNRLTQAVDRAESKGARDSLILIDELALVVNIKNRVVVTAIDKESRKDSIFTNIDSVVMT